MALFFNIRLVFCACLLVTATSQAQPQIDSLKLKLQGSTNNTTRAELISKIAESFFLSARYDSLGKYGIALEQLAKQIDNQEFQWLAKTYQAQAYMRVDSAKFFSETQSILKICEEHKFVKGIAINCLGLGSRLLTLGKYQEALQYLTRGAKAITAEHDLIGIKSDLIRTVSAVHHHQGNYTEALEYGLESSSLAEAHGDPIQVLKSYLNLGGLYGELASEENGLGTVSDRQRYQVEARKYMKLSYQFSKQYASKLSQGATAFNLGSLYLEIHQHDSARQFLNEAIRLGKETSFHELLSNAYRATAKLVASDSGLYFLDLALHEADSARNPISKVGTMLDKAKIFFNEQKSLEAERIALLVLSDAKALKLLNDQRSVYLLLYQIQESRQNYREALKYYTLHNQIKDSIVNEKNFARIEELKAKYESELKDNEIRDLEQRAALQQLQLRQKNVVVAGVILVTLLLVALLVLFFRQRAYRQQQQMLQIENRFLRFQLDPHFISNALVSIQRFMLENNAMTASGYLAKFSRLMRQLLEYSRAELITIEEEIDLLKNYLDIQKLRLKDRFVYTIEVDEKLLITEQRIPPMFTQPFVENAIEHGIRELSAGKIDIVFKTMNESLQIIIRDNGKGIAEADHAGKTSLSTKIIQERMNLLNKTGKFPIQLSVNSGVQGTVVNLILPIYL
ncbi:MAG: histidine kinase [Cytophagales bacterium]|nr:histidine kinase [Cytophagales bacterium]